MIDFQPLHTVFIDLETFYSKDFTLSKMTTESYVRDPRYQTIGVGVSIDDEEPEWFGHQQFLEFVYAFQRMIGWEKCAVAAHNTPFDGLILAHHYKINPGLWIDTLGMAKAKHGTTVGGSLKKLADYYDLGEKGTEVLKAIGKRREDFTPEEWLEYGEYCKNDVRLERALFLKLMEDFPENELWQVDATIRAFVDPILELDVPLIQKFLVEENARKISLMERINQDRSILMSNDKFANLLMTLGVDPPTKISIPKTKTARKKNPDAEPVHTWAFAKSDAGMQELLDHEDDQVRFAAEARVAVKSTIDETRAQRFLSMWSRGPMCVQLNYHHAHTGRWSGGGKTNFQNLGRVVKNNPNSGILKKSLLAPDGMMVAAADSSQVEARGVAWLAGHDELVQAFAQGKDIYSEFASEIYHRPIDRQNNPDDELPGRVGKQAILGLGYNMGAAKFAITLLALNPPIQFTVRDAMEMGVNLDKVLTDPELVEKLANIPTRLPLEDFVIHFAVCQQIVWTYRSKHRPIPALWKMMDEVLGAMDEGVEATFGPNDCLITFRHGILLPSGRILKYPGLERDEDGNFSYLGDYKQRTYLYGGKLVENIIQAMARDIVAEQGLRIRAKYGWRWRLMTHDELAYVEHEGKIGHVVYSIVNEMKTPPDWAKGWPVDAEGGTGKSYGECSLKKVKFKEPKINPAIELAVGAA